MADNDTREHNFNRFLEASHKFQLNVQNEKWSPRKITNTFYQCGFVGDPEVVWNNIVQTGNWGVPELVFFALREFIEGALIERTLRRIHNITSTNRKKQIKDFQQKENRNGDNNCK